MTDLQLKARKIVVNMQFQVSPLTLEQAKRCALLLCDYVLDNLENHTGDEIKEWCLIKEEIIRL